MSSSPADQGVDPEAAREAARDILSGAEYDEPQPGLVERAVTWVFDRVGDFFGDLAGGGPGGVVGWAVVLLLGAVAVWLLVRALRVAPAGAGRPAGDGVRYGTEAHRDAARWLVEAERLGATGDHRGALRCRHQALLARLATAGVVDEVPGRTAGEHGRSAAERMPQVAGEVADATDRFDRAWYGGTDVDREDVVVHAALCRRIEAVAADHPGAVSA
jgi:hypothetical protein